MQHSKFIIIKGEEPCLSRGFEHLKKNMVTLNIKTIEYEKPRKFQLVDVDQYDPVCRKYVSFGKYYADVVTGTLYDPRTGDCLSSSQIKLVI